MGASDSPSQPETPDDSDGSGDCGSCPFMSGSVENRTATLDILFPKFVDDFKLPEWLSTNFPRGPFAANSKIVSACLTRSCLGGRAALRS